MMQTSAPYYHLPVMSYERTEVKIKTPYYSPGISARNREFRPQQKMLPCKRISQGEQNGANFSFVAPSTLGIKDHKQ